MAIQQLNQFRVLVAPGLHNSGPDHWQSRWQRLYPRFERVEQKRWSDPVLLRWADRLDEVLDQDRRPTLIVAHSFGCLTTALSLSRSTSPTWRGSCWWGLPIPISSSELLAATRRTALPIDHGGQHQRPMDDGEKRRNLGAALGQRLRQRGSAGTYQR